MEVQPKGFWTALARGLKELVLEDVPSDQDGMFASPATQPRHIDDSSVKNRQSVAADSLRRSKSRSNSVRRQVDGSSINSPNRVAMMQGGLDAIVSSISLIGDTLGTALEESIQRVAAAADDVISPQQSKEGGTTRGEVVEEDGNEPQQDTGKNLSHKIQEPQAGDQGQESEENKPAIAVKAKTIPVVLPMESKPSKPMRQAPAVTPLADRQQKAQPTTVPLVTPPACKVPNAASKVAGGTKAAAVVVANETQLMASRNVATAMAMRAKQLQADVKAARKDAMEAREQSRSLREENARLQAQLGEARRCSSGCGHEVVASEQEEMLRDQVEVLLQEKRKLIADKSTVERENEMLHQLLLYYEHMYMREENIPTPLDLGSPTSVGSPTLSQ